MISIPSILFPLFLVLLYSTIDATNDTSSHNQFLHCLITSQTSSNSSSSIANLAYTQTNPSYTSILRFSIRNPRFDTASTPKPLLIVTPETLLHVQATVKCSRLHGLHLRIRSGGHDYEGLSYASIRPDDRFVVVDMIRLRQVTVDVAERTAWVQSGATLGELYYAIAQKSRTLGFPGGVCPSVGVGGYLGGGGYGTMLRKHGLAADNVVDVVLVDAKGRVLDRDSMGEDVFWAVRGGGGNTFGVVVAWKVNLVTVPETVTVFRVRRTLDQNLTKLVYRWQTVANELPKDIIIMTTLQKVISNGSATTIQATFNSLFLGGQNDVVQLMEEKFPELGLVIENCTEMSWIESTLHFARFPRDSPMEVLLNRTVTLLTGTAKYKLKSDYVQTPIPESTWEEVWKRLDQLPPLAGAMVLVPYGGRMDEISSSSLPFPHRAGNLYKIQYDAFWNEDGVEASEKNLRWIRELYAYMASFVSKDPRAAYVNYRDLDVGRNGVEGARVWGVKYFKGNFERLVKVKTAIDPQDFFGNEQSIPPISAL